MGYLACTCRTDCLRDQEPRLRGFLRLHDELQPVDHHYTRQAMPPVITDMEMCHFLLGDERMIAQSPNNFFKHWYTTNYKAKGAQPVARHCRVYSVEFHLAHLNTACSATVLSWTLRVI